MKDFCFYVFDDFCYRHLRKIKPNECGKKCPEYRKAICDECKDFIIKECPGKDRACEEFIRKQRWAFEIHD